jgi:hypothetical protein
MVYSRWDWLHRITDAQEPASVMSLILNAKLLKKVPEHESVVWFELMTAICPMPQRQELREQLADFDQSLTMTPFALLDILNAMENYHTHV